MNILAIETSCDDTCIAILKFIRRKSSSLSSSLFLGSLIGNFKLEILSNIVSSQVKIHQKYGGVYPTLAKREHERNLPIVLKKALKEANLEISKKNPKINLISVTIGPGLEPCLWAGINFAKDLAKNWKLPIVPVNHIKAHLLANWLTPVKETFNFHFSITKKIFPAVGLVVSGGHTQLILISPTSKSDLPFAGKLKYKILGQTRDDAAGECFDKVARILLLGYPGGPVISQLAANYKFKIQSPKFKIKLPRPMINQKNYDFSFSGLKTAVLYEVRTRSLKTRKAKSYLQEISFETQQAIIDVLINKTFRAVKEYKAKSIILGGGVTANDELRKQFKAESLNLKVNFFVPPKNLSTDNAAMVAVAGYFNWLKKKNWKKIEADANLRVDQNI